MILLQILAGLLLIPLTVIMVIIFNVYVINWVYGLFVSLFIFIFSLLCGLLIHNLNAAFWIFSILLVPYMLRMSYFAAKFAAFNRETPLAIHGKIRNEKFRLTFMLPLSFFRIVKWLPLFLRQKITAQLQVDLVELVEEIIQQSMGTKIEIQSDETAIYIEIK